MRPWGANPHSPSGAVEQSKKPAPRRAHRRLEGQAQPVPPAPALPPPRFTPRVRTRAAHEALWLRAHHAACRSGRAPFEMRARAGCCDCLQYLLRRASHRHASLKFRRFSGPQGARDQGARDQGWGDQGWGGHGGGLVTASRLVAWIRHRRFVGHHRRSSSTGCHRPSMMIADDAQPTGCHQTATSSLNSISASNPAACGGWPESPSSRLRQLGRCICSS